MIKLMFIKGCSMDVLKALTTEGKAEAQRGAPASRWWQSQCLSMGLSDCKVKSLGKVQAL